MSPGFEFLISFKNFDLREIESYLRKFPDRPSARDACAHFEVRVEIAGIYFNDLARSDFSARMFRLMVELALEFSEVQISGFGVAALPSLPAGLLTRKQDPTQIRVE